MCVWWSFFLFPNSAVIKECALTGLQKKSSFTTYLRSSAYTREELAPNVCKWAKCIDCFSASDSQQPFFGDKTKNGANQEDYRRPKAFIVYLRRSVRFHLSCVCHSRFWLSAHTDSPETNPGARSWNPGLPSSAPACSSRSTSAAGGTNLISNAIFSRNSPTMWRWRDVQRWKILTGGQPSRFGFALVVLERRASHTPPVRGPSWCHCCRKTLLQLLHSTAPGQSWRQTAGRSTWRDKWLFTLTTLKSLTFILLTVKNLILNHTNG